MFKTMTIDFFTGIYPLLLLYGLGHLNLENLKIVSDFEFRMKK